MLFSKSLYGAHYSIFSSATKQLNQLQNNLQSHNSGANISQSAPAFNKNLWDKKLTATKVGIDREVKGPAVNIIFLRTLPMRSRTFRLTLVF